MTVEDIVWFLAFGLCLPNVVWSLLTIISYLKHKPPGHQSVYDIVAIDVLYISLLTGCVYCIIPMISLTDVFEIYFKDKSSPVTLLSIIFEFSFACNVTSIGCGSLVRIFCIIDISLVEDSLDDAMVGPWLILVSIIVAMIYICLVAVSGDLNTGIPFNFMSRQNVPAGSIKLCLMAGLYLFCFATWIAMQAVLKMKNRRSPDKSCFVLRTFSFLKPIFVVIFSIILAIDAQFVGTAESHRFGLLRHLLAVIGFYAILPISVLYKNPKIRNYFKTRLLTILLFKQVIVQKFCSRRRFLTFKQRQIFPEDEDHEMRDQVYFL